MGLIGFGQKNNPVFFLVKTKTSFNWFGFAFWPVVRSDVEDLSVEIIIMISSCGFVGTRKKGLAIKTKRRA